MGLLLKQKYDEKDVSFIHMPFSLFPMPYPSESFMEACELQIPFGRIVAGLIREP
jgi:hypothetical protein